jgi:hypothetical protein
MSKRTRSDSPDKACTKEGCERPLRARGLCASHYNQKHQPDRHKTRLANCAYCGVEIITRPGGGRKHGPVCSTKCKTWLATPYCVLPADHWARWYGKASAWTPPKPKAVPKMQRECQWCGDAYETHQSQSKYCDDPCAKKASKLRRRAREHNAPGMYSWAQVMRLFMAADKQCAYCDEQVDGQPDPDHVIPLSRGGRNDIGNIVACCRLCNSDKSDLTLDEWALERIRLGKRPLRYVLDHKDPRFMHLTLNTASGIAWRHLTDA